MTISEKTANKQEYKARVSIVLPAYNAECFIRQAIESCLGQTYRSIELLVVDDGSGSRATEEIVRSFADARLAYVCHEENKGLPEALNSGFAAAQGAYLTWTSADNYYDPAAIEKMVFHLNQRGVQFLYADYFRVTHAVAAHQERVKLPDAVNFQKGNAIGPCFLYTRSVKEAIGEYDTETFLAEDYDYWMRIARRFTMYHLPEPLYYYREHGDSLYCTRFVEVKTTDFLARFKNGYVNILQAQNLFASFLAGQINERSSAKCHALVRKLRGEQQKLRLHWFVGRHVAPVLKDYQDRRISFARARQMISVLIGQEIERTP